MAYKRTKSVTSKVKKLTILEGVTLTVKPHSPLVSQMGRGQQERAIKSLDKTLIERITLGKATDAERLEFEAVARTAFLEGTLMALVTGWEGILQIDKDEPEVFSHDTLMEIMRNDAVFAMSVQNAIESYIAESIAEKKGLKPLQNGTLVAEQGTVKTVDAKKRRVAKG